VAGDAQVWVDRDSPLFDGHTEAVDPGWCVNSPCPDHRCGRDPFAATKGHPVAVHLDDVGG